LLAIGSAWLGQTRLLDNLPFVVAPAPAIAGAAR
jgi:hypothetical protein